MATWTIHLPPEDGPDPAGAERFVTVKDGLRPFVILFGPFWFLWKRLWVGFAGVLALQAALALVEWRLGAPQAASAALQALLNVLLALEAPTIQRWTLGRRRWREIGAVVAHGRAEAEMRAAALVAALDPAASGPPEPASSQPSRRLAPPPASPVLGLFPEAVPR